MKATKDLTIHYWPRLPNEGSQIVVRYLTNGGQEFSKTIRGECGEPKKSLFDKAPAEITICDSCRCIDDDLINVLLDRSKGNQIDFKPSAICRACRLDDAVKWRDDVYHLIGDLIKPN